MKCYPKTLIVVLLLIIVICQSCDTKSRSFTQSYLDKNSHRLEELVKKVNEGNYGTVHSVLIRKNDSILFEKYFNQWEVDSLHMLQSVTKSLVSTLLGIAIQEGYISTVDEKVLSFFNRTDIKNIDSLKEKMTIEDLLTQRHGLDWEEGSWNSPENNWRKILASEGNWYNQILSTPMASEPGTVFNYGNAAPVLVTGIIQKASGMDIDEFAKKFLFEPLSIKKYKFWQGNGGPAKNGSALVFLSSRDMTKIGQLYLNNGMWNGKQILPKNWTDIVSNNSLVKNIKDNKFYRFGYSYFWWNSPKAIGGNVSVKPDIYLARGAGGQYIIVDEKEDMIIVITAWDIMRANFIFEIYTKYIQPMEYYVPKLEPKLLASEILTNNVETSVTFTPDKKELFFAKKDSFYASNQKSTIYYSRLSNGKWTKPEVAKFSGKYSDSSPFVTPDGNRIYFSSNRPVSKNIDEKDDRDIWYVEKIGNSWSQPKYEIIYNSNKSEYSPTLDQYGNLYFGSYRDGGNGSGDIWVSLYKNGKYQNPINLGENINSSRGEWGSCISMNGNFLIFEASGRSENITYDGDLYISYKEENGWTKAKHLGQLNSGGSDLSPKIHGNYLYFASNRHNDPFVEVNNNNVDLYQVNISDVLKHVDADN